MHVHVPLARFQIGDLRGGQCRVALDGADGVGDRHRHTGIGPGKSLRVVSQNYDQTVSIELPTGASILGRPAAEAVWLRPES